MIIESISNPKVQLLRSLYSKKGRDESDLFVVEGVNLLRDLPLNVEVKYLFVDDSKEGSFSDLLSQLSEQHPLAEVITLSAKLFSRIAETVTPQGLIACCKKMEYDVTEILGKNKLMILDGVSDPGNVGTIIRSSSGAGFEGVLLFNSCDPYSPKVIRSTMGGIFRVPVLNLNYDEFDYNGCVYLLHMVGNSIFEEIPPQKYAIVVGSEAKGASQYFRDRANKTLSIPMENDTESLNAGVSASLAMYILKNNRR